MPSDCKVSSFQQGIISPCAHETVEEVRRTAHRKDRVAAVGFGHSAVPLGFATGGQSEGQRRDVIGEKGASVAQWRQYLCSCRLETNIAAI
jgi:hypothetical protein